jgi:nucleoside phosphorylase
MVEPTTGAAPVEEPELVAHIFLPNDGPHAEWADKSLQQLWSRCGEWLKVTDPITLPGDPHLSIVDMRQSPERDFQVVARREHDVRNLSLLLASQDSPDGRSPWQRMDRLLDTVTGGPADGFIGMVRLYLAKAKNADALRNPGELGPEIAVLLPEGAQEKGWWKRPFRTTSGLVAWEIGAREETRVERRIVVLAPSGGDRDLSEWTWSDGLPDMPPFARYLMHIAKIRYEQRVRERAVSAGRLCRVIDEGAAHVSEFIDAGTRSDALDHRLARLRADRARAETLIGGLEAMRQTNEIARANAESALGLEDMGLEDMGLAAGSDDLIADDLAQSALFDRRLRDDIVYLRSSIAVAHRVTEIAAEMDHPLSTSMVAEPTAVPVFGIVTALPEECAAMETLLDNAVPDNVEKDRANYVLGVVPSRDPERPHRVVLTMLGDTANDAAADACTNLIRSYPSVGHVLMVGIAAGVPDPRRPDRHVRLGDIVVSTWGIVDYDHVIDRAPEPVLRQPFPRPSRLLNQSTNWLIKEELRGRRPWEEWISFAEAELPDCVRPPASTDLLHPSDGARRPVPHPPIDESGHRAGRPKVHYGFIGSADRSLRNSRTRDRLAGKHNLRAFEMEGKGVGNAGFANGLEWLVIRGVSDYGDRRTDARWRGYASLVAAAYARALLAACPPVAPRGGHTGGVRGGS